MLKRFLVTFCIVGSIVIVFSAVVTKKREDRRTLESMHKELAEKVASLNKKNSDLKKKNDALVNDPIEIEREARNEHGYIKSGEVTFKKYKFDIKEPEINDVEKSSLLIRMDSFLFDGTFPWQVPLGLIFIAAIFLIVTYIYESRRLHR